MSKNSGLPSLDRPRDHPQHQRPRLEPKSETSPRAEPYGQRPKYGKQLGEHIKRPLTKKSGITISLCESWQQTHPADHQARQQSSSILERIQARPSKQTTSKIFQLPPAPPIKTASSSTVSMNDISKHLTGQLRQGNHKLIEATNPQPHESNSSRLAISFCPERQK